MATQWNIPTVHNLTSFPAKKHTHTNIIKSVLTRKIGIGQMWKVRGYCRQVCKGKVWIFSDPVETKPVGFLCSCSSNLLYLFCRERGGKADVLYVQMAEVNLRSVSEVCEGGWLGGGMTIEFRERAMWTDGPWLPPKIPLRKMAGLTYFWTHHAVQMYCEETDKVSAFIS